MSEHYFRHNDAIWNAFPQLSAVTVRVTNIHPTATVSNETDHYWDRARKRLEFQTEGQFPEIQAWRKTFAAMKLKPTQYRCASESLLRRFRREDSLPSIHPLIDLCNAFSIAFAIPIAVFDLDQIDNSLEVRFAHGSEAFEDFSGDQETPPKGEVVFADASGWAHARRWTHRQSRRSAVRPGSSNILIVSEAMHPTGKRDVLVLGNELANIIGDIWNTTATLGHPEREIPGVPL